MNEESFFESSLRGTEQTIFNMFEPFDVLPRPQWVMDAAKKAEVEIDPQGNLFQTGMLIDDVKTPGFALTLAGSQTGKSRSHLLESVIMASGEIPISLRFNKGDDTGVKRLITPDNIRRFGRFDSATGALLDYNTKAPPPDEHYQWDCGNIIGVGKYPVEKLPPPGSQIWICTYKEIKQKMWIPRFREIIPLYFLEEGKGAKGFSEHKQTFFFKNGSTISFITYEQDYKRVEGEKQRVNLIILDEEPPDRNFYISALEHCQYLRICFSPIKGLTWAYRELYLPIINGQNQFCKIYYCSQYDSPYQNKEEVDRKLQIYKPYEIKARVWGRFSDMAGKPYYTFEITQANLRTFIPRHSYARIMPGQKPETVRETLNIKMRMDISDEKKEDTWEIYEDYMEDASYWISADIAEGNENPDAAEDASVAYVCRLPREGETELKMVACLYSRIRNVEFSWMCLYAAIYYNCALLAPEARGEDAAVFLTTVMGYPFLYRHVVTSDKTRRLKETDGFDTTSANRKVIFDLAGTWIYDHVGNPHIHHYQLLQEYLECIVGKNGRPDHGGHGHTDCLIAWGIALYVWTFAKYQIRNNRDKKYCLTNEAKPSMFPNIFNGSNIKETRKVLGSTRGMDRREKHGQSSSLYSNRRF